MYYSDKHALILFSGGIDSTACISYYLDQGYSVTPLLINYGQSAFNGEHVAAELICKYFIQDLKVLSIPTGVHSNGEIPGRNLFLLSAALVYLGNARCLISLGIHAGTLYYDCSEVFIKNIQAIFDAYTFGKVRIDTPFINWSKAEIIAYSKLNNLPIGLTYSCEVGSSPPCQVCGSCKERNSHL